MLHVAYCCDKTMLPGLHAAVASMLLHQESPLTLWFFLQHCTPHDESLVRKTAQRAAAVNFVCVDLARYAGLRGLLGSNMPYARLAMPELVRSERLVYLDCDTVCLTSLTPLWQTAMEDKAMAMVQFGKLGEKREKLVYQRSGLSPDAPHYNSGVILFDVMRWREARCHARCLDFGADNRHELFTADQTCINGALAGDIKPLASHWNVPLFPGSATVGEGSHGRIFHFVGTPKPWEPLAFLVHRNVRLHRIWLAKAGVSLRGLRRLSQPKSIRQALKNVRLFGKRLTPRR